MKKPNILFIMCDQLRADYLSCYGHSQVHTPHIDSIADNGVRFDKAYVPSPICGPSRMATYTGRYLSTHGVSMNYAAMSLSERFLGHYLAEYGLRTAVVGKTHVKANEDDMRWLGIDPESEQGQRIGSCGFEPYFRDDGVHPDNPRALKQAYNQYLLEKGYDSSNPWHHYANGAQDNGDFKSGWFFANASYPADIKESDSETAVMTQKAMDFIEEAGDAPWCLHLSYIKPHWPYIAPAPYHDMYAESEIPPPNRSQAEKDMAHPVIAAYMQHSESVEFSRDEVRNAIIPVYMGLIKQIDDYIGKLLAFLDEKNLRENTIIVFTSDHGDYLGDHWLGEKDLFHEESVRVPLIIADPRPKADATRGTVSTELVSTIDLVPTFIDMVGGKIPYDVLEGHSLRPLLDGDAYTSQEVIVSELDYSYQNAREILDIPQAQCRVYMLRTHEWKYVFYEGFRPQLFDLQNDPQEQHDLGASDDHQTLCRQFEAQLNEWIRYRKRRVTMTEQRVETMYSGANQARRGVYVGYTSEDDLPAGVPKPVRDKPNNISESKQ